MIVESRISVQSRPLRYPESRAHLLGKIGQLARAVIITSANNSIAFALLPGDKKPKTAARAGPSRNGDLISTQYPSPVRPRIHLELRMIDFDDAFTVIHHDEANPIVDQWAEMLQTNRSAGRDHCNHAALPSGAGLLVTTASSRSVSTST